MDSESSEHEAATARGLEELKSLPRATAVRFNPASRQVELDLNVGYSVNFSPLRAQDLHEATDEELSEVEIAGVGFGIYFPRIDADLWVPSLVKGRFGNDRWEAAWLAAHPLEANPQVRVQDIDEEIEHPVSQRQSSCAA